MGFLDRLFGSEPAPQNPSHEPARQDAKSEDELALEKYRYLLRTAPPETIEQVHAEAFARLTEPQRQQVLAELSAGLSASEQPASTEPQAMARAATRAEYTNPGFMERTLGQRGQGGTGPSFGSMMGSSLLGTVAGYVIGSAIVSSFMAPAFADGGSSTDSGSEGASDGGGADDAGASGDADAGGDFGGGADFGGGGDFGGGFGDFGF